ncbi:MAG: transcriptional regulator [Deltaproteobacteria bacterium RBG_13_51_10]|nr:MAG: transcriptional regulator [Deltaproteobacteria bacterium RBG_13_51_10]
MSSQKFSAEDKKLIRKIQGDLPLSLTPFESVAQQLGWEEIELLKRVRRFIRRGRIRRFGAILRHQRAGYQGNAMVVWKVPEDQIPRVTRAMIAFPAVSHCYLRPSLSQWPFNLYTMVHGPRARDCRLIAQQLSRETGLKDYQLLFSKREHKKSSMRYFEQQ